MNIHKLFAYISESFILMPTSQPKKARLSCLPPRGKFCLKTGLLCDCKITAEGGCATFNYLKPKLDIGELSRVEASATLLVYKRLSGRLMKWGK
jgi:hypothetical protein